VILEAFSNNRLPSKYPRTAHVSLSVVTLLTIISLVINLSVKSEEMQSVAEFGNFYQDEKAAFAYSEVCGIGFIVAQMLFSVNLIIGLLPAKSK